MDSNDPKARFYARTMHTPDDAERAALRQALRDVSKQLLPLHRALIDAAKEDYAFAYAPVESPTRLLQLLQEDPFFEWLKPITSLIVDIDEMVRRDFTRDDANDIVARLDRMFGPTADPAFAERYVPMLQRDLDVAASHAALRRLIGVLRG
jgi:hypothetical protein